MYHVLSEDGAQKSLDESTQKVKQDMIIKRQAGEPLSKRLKLDHRIIVATHCKQIVMRFALGTIALGLEASAGLEDVRKFD